MGVAPGGGSGGGAAAGGGSGGRQRGGGSGHSTCVVKYHTTPGTIEWEIWLVLQVITEMSIQRIGK